MYFTDMYSDSQVSEEVGEDDMLWEEGFGGTLQWEELMEIVTEIGFSPPMLVEVSPISIEIHSCIGMLFMCRLLYGCAMCTVCRLQAQSFILYTIRMCLYIFSFEIHGLSI